MKVELTVPSSLRTMEIREITIDTNDRIAFAPIDVDGYPVTLRISLQPIIDLMPQTAKDNVVLFLKTVALELYKQLDDTVIDDDITEAPTF